MKDFIKKVIVFLSLSLLVVVSVLLGSNYIVKSLATFKIDENVTQLVIGHSHSECSINDSILRNSINLSSSGEAYFYNFQKLKLVAGDNKQINTVLIEFANSQVDSAMDDWIWGYEKMSFYLQFYSPFLDSEDIKLLLKHNSTDLPSSYSVATRKLLYRILANDYNLVDEMGGFANSKLSKVDEMIANNKFNRTISEDHSLSETNLSYLRKMIDFCKKNNIRVFLIRSPQHPLYADLVNEPLYQKVLKTQFNDVELLDFDAMNFPNSEYLDLHHLNYKGANKFTTLFNTLIENDLLNSDHKQSIIDKSIKDFNENN